MDLSLAKPLSIWSGLYSGRRSIHAPRINDGLASAIAGSRIVDDDSIVREQDRDEPI